MKEIDKEQQMALMAIQTIIGKVLAEFLSDHTNPNLVLERMKESLDTECKTLIDVAKTDQRLMLAIDYNAAINEVWGVVEDQVRNSLNLD